MAMKKHITLCMLFLSALIAYGQELTIEVERDTINLESDFLVSYTINESCNPTDLKFENFIVVSGPSVSRSISFVNGKRSAETKLRFLLTPIEEGTFELPSQMCDAKMSEPLKIVVKKGYETLEDVDKRIREKRKIKKI